MEKQGRNEIMLKSLNNHLVNLCVPAGKSSQHTGLFVLMHARAGYTLACLSGLSWRFRGEEILDGGVEKEERSFYLSALPSFRFSLFLSSRNASYSGWVHIIIILILTRVSQFASK